MKRAAGITGLAGILAMSFLAELGYADTVHEIDVEMVQVKLKGRETATCTVKLTPRENADPKKNEKGVTVTSQGDTIVWHVKNNCLDVKGVSIDNFSMLPHALLGGKRSDDPLEIDKKVKKVKSGEALDISAKVKVKANTKWNDAYKYDLLFEGTECVGQGVFEVAP